MSVQAAISRTFAKFHEITGNRTFTWNGSTVVCVPESNVDSIQIKAGGFEGNPGLRLLVEWALWKSVDSTLITLDSDAADASTDFGDSNAGASGMTDETGSGITTEGGARIGWVDPSGMRRPVTGKRLTYRGRDYRIDSAKLSLFGTHVLLDLGEVNR